MGTGAVAGYLDAPQTVRKRLYPDGTVVMIDPHRQGTFKGRKRDGASADEAPLPNELHFGVVIGACGAMTDGGTTMNNYEYTVMVEDNYTECSEEQFLQPLFLQSQPPSPEDMPWVSGMTREVAVWVETHGDLKFAAYLVSRSHDKFYEVKFVADGTVLRGVPRSDLFEPDQDTIRGDSPQSRAPDALWLLDRKIQANIDADPVWSFPLRIRRAKEELTKHHKCRCCTCPRCQTTNPFDKDHRCRPIRGPFTGKGDHDSEDFPSHPCPLPELTVDGKFVDMWGKYAGKIKFAPTYKIGPGYPRNDAWVESIDVAEPLYFQAALPVYAGLICLGMFKGKPEWVRASDVALVGIALYVNGELHPGFTDPPMEKLGLQKYGHEACRFIPGCVSTYMVDAAWVGATFCLSPTDNDYEVRDDIYNIKAYHHLINAAARKPHDFQAGPREINVEVHLVLSTNYLANVRKVCSGTIRVLYQDKGLAIARERLAHIEKERLSSHAAMYPKRPQKPLSEDTHEQFLERKMEAEKAAERENARTGAQQAPQKQLALGAPPQQKTLAPPQPPQPSQPPQKKLMPIPPALPPPMDSAPAPPGTMPSADFAAAGTRGSRTGDSLGEPGVASRSSYGTAPVSRQPPKVQDLTRNGVGGSPPRASSQASGPPAHGFKPPPPREERITGPFGGRPGRGEFAGSSPGQPPAPPAGPRDGGPFGAGSRRKESPSFGSPDRGRSPPSRSQTRSPDAPNVRLASPPNLRGMASSPTATRPPVAKRALKPPGQR